MRLDWQQLASMMICIALGVVGVALAYKYLLGALLPFLLAWGVALLIAPAAAWLAAHTHLPRRLWAVVLPVAGLGLVGGGLYFVVDRLIFETGALLSRLGGLRAADIAAVLDDIIARLPLLGDLFDSGAATRERIIGVLMDAMSGVQTELGGQLSSMALKTVTGLPGGLLSLTVGIVACFYFTLQLDDIHAALLSLLPERLRAFILGTNGRPPLRRRLASGLWRWLRAYLILFFMTFGELLIGFLVLKVDYALLIALLVAVVDLLPVLGTGTVLLPWALWCFAVGQSGRGVGLLVLYGIITVVHQVAEPHVVGSSVGVHPLVSLIAMYVGFKLFGLPGLVLLPGVMCCARRCLTAPTTG